MVACRSLSFAGLVVPLVAAISAADPPAGPAYQIVLRSRHAEVTPTRTRDAQTGGGSIVVEQLEPNTVIVTMGGSAVVGSDCHGSAAGIDFRLDQDLEIVPTRPGIRLPRIGMMGQVVGTLQVTDPGKGDKPCGSAAGKCGKSCGAADQGPAAACLAAGETSLLSVNVESAAVSCGQELAINHRTGPVEFVAAAGDYHLSGSFRIGASQGKGVFYRQYAVADFDPAPQLDAFWADALKPFRAVPRRDFGFKVVVRVVEDAPPVVVAPK
jgi:hypothetical protein